MQSNDDKKILTLSDLFAILSKSKRIILLTTVVFTLISAFWILSSPVRYTVEATFRDKGKTSAGIQDTILGTLMIGGTGDSSHDEVISLMKSRKLLAPLIKNLCLQAVVTGNENKQPGLLKNISSNLKISYAHFRHRMEPIFADSPLPIKVTMLNYNEEFPSHFTIHYLSDNQFEIISPRSNQTLGTGKNGELISFDNIQFTISSISNDPLIHKQYELTLLPLQYVTENLSKSINIEKHNKDKNLLIIKYTSLDRYQGVELVNTLMKIYQEYLKKDHEYLSRKQIAYLQMRQEEIVEKLNDMMLVHANKVSTDSLEYGFIDTEKAMQFLATMQQHYKEKLFAIDLESKRLQKAIDESFSHQALSLISTDYPQINTLVSEIKKLNKQRESLDLALRCHNCSNDEKKHDFLKDQIAHLNEIYACKSKVEEAIISLNENRMPANLFQFPRYLNPSWENQLQIAYHDQNTTSPSGWIELKKNFLSYLNHLNQLLDVHQETIHERISHQQGNDTQFQGINLNIADQLYISYTKELQDNEANIHQYNHILNQLGQNDMEISTLSTSLHDPVSAEMIKESKQILLALKDDQNRLPKEQERLKDQLKLQKEFLQTHLEQSNQLFQLNSGLLQNKLFALNDTMLGLVQQEISILSKQLEEFILSRLFSLEQEREILNQQLQEIQKDIEKIPHQWVSEKIIDHHLSLYNGMSHEITNLVESKNITSNLEVIRSAPLDWATPPILPDSSRFFLFMLIGAAFGSFAGCCYALFSSLRLGIPLTQRSIEDRQATVAGSLSPFANENCHNLFPNDLKTLRNLIRIVLNNTENTSKDKLILLLQGMGPDYSNPLAELISKRKQRVLLIDLGIDPTTSQKSIKSYLEGSDEFPVINQTSSFDKIPFGDTSSSYREELLGSQRFNEFITKCEKQYDFIIMLSSTKLDSSEAKFLTDKVQKCVVTITNETVDQMIFYLENKDRITFVIA